MTRGDEKRQNSGMDRDFDDTDMSAEEFESRMANGTPVEVSTSPPHIVWVVDSVNFGSSTATFTVRSSAPLASLTPRDAELTSAG